MVVIHYTGMRDRDTALARLCDPAAGVGAHYLIDEDGSVHRLIDEGRRAWHAGEARWRGETDVNGRSLGIELVNPGHEFGYRPFPEPQMAALEDLALDIVKRHPILARNIVGHSDVAPRRKADPGELFDWRRLAEKGIGLWPGEAVPCPAEGGRLTAMLEQYGYDVTDTRAALVAFQRHFRPGVIDGMADAETAGILESLVHACRRQDT